MSFLELYICDICNTSCSKFSNLKRHVKNKHSIVILNPKRRDKGDRNDASNQTGNISFINRSLKCGVCDTQGTKQFLDLHYVEAHQINLNIESIKFINMSNFHDWKSAIEKENNCRYVASCGRRDKVERYICHRSGEFKSKSKGLRSLKRQGSKKIGSYCPSKMIVYKVGEMCDVKFVKTHIGHENEVYHLTLPPEIKSKIAHRLSQNVPPVIVLQEIKNSVGDKNERIRMLNMKDMHNISKEFKINFDGQADHNDNLDITSLVNELENRTDTPILYYKPYEISDNDTQLTAKDFALISMNQTQTEFYQLFGHNIVIIDRTWKISYNLHLITLLVVDNTFQAFPCCFLFSNKDDRSRLEILFSVLHTKLGAMKSKLIMTCTTSDQYYDAWIKVMGVSEHHLYSPWSVHQSWNLNTSKIKNPEKLAQVTEMLKGLFEEPDSKKFPTLLNDAVDKITGQEETRQFGQYFCKYFLREVVKWARCYQIQLGLKDTTDLESVCKMTKCIYYNIKKSGGLSDCILFLFRYLRDKLFNKRIQYSDKEVHRQQECLKRSHQISASKDYSITANDADGWLVTSTFEKTVHEIKKNNINCRCEIYCDACDSCIHNYVCSCTNSSLEWNMCHHIHYLCTNLQLKGSENIIVVDDTITFANDSVICFNESDDLNDFCEDDYYDDSEVVELPDNQSEINAVLEINSLIDEIIMNMQANGSNSSVFVIHNLRKILNTLKAKNTDPLENIIID